MPRNSTQKEIGLLVTDGAQLFLRRDDGGHWRLDAPASIRKFIGNRITIEAVRDGVDLLVVERFSAL
jgi:hypothetical protein